MVKSKSGKVVPSRPTPKKVSGGTPSSSKKTPKKKCEESGEIETLVIGKNAGNELCGKHVKKCLQGVFKNLESKKKSKSGGSSDLFEESGDGQKVCLQVTGIKLPKDERQQLITMSLPHGTKGPDELNDTVLFVKDLEKGIKVDHESTLIHFKELLEKHGVEKQIDEIISLRQLKVEYKTFESKTNLVNRFDTILADDTILRFLPKFLGKPFYKRKKFPVPVNLKAKDLKPVINKAAKTSILPLNHHGTCSMMTIGSTQMPVGDLIDNVMYVADKLKARYPGGWKNIRSIHVKSEKSLSIPLHISTMSSKEVGFVDADIPQKIKAKKITDELSTLPGAKVTVMPHGGVKVIREKDQHWNDEQEEPFISGSEEEDEEEVKEPPPKKAEKKKNKKKELKENPKKRARDSDSESEDEAPKKKDKKDDSDEDSEDEELEAAEMEYMKRIADEEEEMEKKQDYDDDQKIPDDDVIADSDEDEEEDSDDDLMCKATTHGDDDEEVEEKPKMKRKTKKEKRAEVKKQKKSGTPKSDNKKHKKKTPNKNKK